jgi:hypothetical protein
MAYKSASVFSHGHPLFLRFKLASLDRIIPVLCQGITQPGNILAVQWTEESARVSQAPVDATEIQCQMLNAGVLYLLKGQVCGSSSGRLPRVRIRVNDKCVGVKLRSQQRYAVRGKLELLEPGGAVVYTPNHHQKMNISLGGFGTRLPESALPMQIFTGFRLEACVERDSLPDETYPPLILEGEAELRHTVPSSQDGMLYAGFSFSKISDIDLGVLQFWIATNSQVLREL